MASFLYKELTQNELSQVVSSALNTTINDSRLLTGGLFNTTYYIDTADYGKAVLRVGPVNRHLLMPFEHDLMSAEKTVYDLCTQKGIPVSEVLALDTSKKVIDRDFMIVSYIPSKPMNETELNETDRKRIYKEVGRYTAMLHQISAKRFGRITDVDKNGGFELWSDFLLDELKQWESVAAKTEIYTEHEIKQIYGIFDKYKSLLDEVQEARLVHADLWGGNILLSTETEQPEFAAIIDADRALWGDPDFEFSSIQWMINDDFMSGYGRRISEEDADVTRRDIYNLLYRLWNAYVYLIEYNDAENMKAERDIARDLINKLTRR